MTTANVVSRALNKAGWKRSTEYATCVRGFHAWNAGYITRNGTGCAWVSWREDSSRISQSDTAKMLSWMANDLRNAGFTVQERGDSLCITKEAN